jgi:hypothetical protein
MFLLQARNIHAASMAPSRSKNPQPADCTRDRLGVKLQYS